MIYGALMENTKVSVPYDWLKSLSPEVLRLDEVPLLGHPPAFPWDQFSSLIGKTFELSGLRIEPGDLRWRGEEELYQDLGDSLSAINITVSGFDGRAYWIMEDQDINALMRTLLLKDDNKTPFIDPDPEFREGFYNFLGAEAIRAFSELNFDKTLTPHILKETALPQESSLCLDVKITLEKQTLWGRLVVSPEFRQSWKDHFGQRKQNVILSQSVAQKIPLSLHVEIGKVELSHSEWDELSPGDFIVLDSCTVDPQEEKGRATLTLNESPLFKVRLKENNVKILEFPLSYHEEYATMEKEPPEEESEWEDESDEDFSDESEEDLELDETGEEEEEEHPDEEEEEELSEEEEEEEVPEEDEDLELGEKDEKTKASTTSPLSKISARPLASEKKPITPHDVPVTLVIEVGRIQISVGKLLELQPGNLLEVDVKPENGVDLVVNGRCVGKGELLRVGETLGVRVLDLT